MNEEQLSLEEISANFRRDLNESKEKSIDLDTILQDIRMARSKLEKYHRKLVVLDAADKGEMSKIISLTPGYNMNVNHNPINIIKESTKCSLMPSTFIGTIKTMVAGDSEFEIKANVFMKELWEKLDVDKINGFVADNAYLGGVGIFQVGIDVFTPIKNPELIDALFGSTKITARSLHPLNVLVDPSASNVQECRFIDIQEQVTVNQLMSYEPFVPVLSTLVDSKGKLINSGTTAMEDYMINTNIRNPGDFVTIHTYYQKQVHTTDVLDEMTGEVLKKAGSSQINIIYLVNDTILHEIHDIQPSLFPFAFLYDEQVPMTTQGISRAARVLPLVLALNKIDSLEATQYVRQQNPVTLVSNSSGLDQRKYQTASSVPGRTVSVAGDPGKAVYQVPVNDTTKGLQIFRAVLNSYIREVSGVNPQYAGENFGSIQTTGAMEQAVERATVRDRSRILNIENYLKEVTQILILMAIEHEEPMLITIPKQEDLMAGYQPTQEDIMFDPREFIENKVKIILNADKHTPSSKAETQNLVLELFKAQFQYNLLEQGMPLFITPEELVEYLNIPMKTDILSRIKKDKTVNKLQEYTTVLTAVGQLTQMGATPEEALMQIANMMQGIPLPQQAPPSPATGQDNTKNP